VEATTVQPLLHFYKNKALKKSIPLPLDLTAKILMKPLMQKPLQNTLAQNIMNTILQERML